MRTSCGLGDITWGLKKIKDLLKTQCIDDAPMRSAQAISAIGLGKR